ncbi:MAG: hypothetical protein E7618_03145 [Ruminococcaceae bacterium]|nr:hypothetical protein [Oscillospiraceae bacterium]
MICRNLIDQKNRLGFWRFNESKEVFALREQNWKRKEYETWDEAFRGLAPVVRQQSVRVAAYTQALFVQAVKLHFGENTADGKERMRGQYADFMYKCGLYHQLGKALVPPEYQIEQADFTDEERAVYQKYTTDGRILVANLQEKGAHAKVKRGEGFIERPTKNLPWLILRECCEQHMERWDGSGYPAGRLGSDISVSAQIVSLAKELDRIASETKSEEPFELACQSLIADAGHAWSPELIEVLKASKEACAAVYQKYITYTRTLPKTIPLVERRPDRVMGLSYRPMAAADGYVPLYEAEPWFAGVPDRPGETETAEELHDLFERTHLVEDISWYFLYEATDTILRMTNCNLGLEGLLLTLPRGFFLLGSQLQKFNALFADQPIDKSRLLLTLPDELLRNANKTTAEILGRYLRNGIRLVLDDYRPDEVLTAERLIEMGFTHVRLAPDLYDTPAGAAAIGELRLKGITVFGKQADTPERQAWLYENGVHSCSGTMCGITVSEDDMILDCLDREKV